MKELDRLKPVLKKYKFSLEVTMYSSGSFTMSLFPENGDDMETLITLYDVPIKERVDFIIDNIDQLNYDCKEGLRNFSWSGEK